jgi:hypothetical protein
MDHNSWSNKYDPQCSQLQSVFVPGASNYFHNGYGTNSITFSPIGSQLYPQELTTSQAPQFGPQTARGHAVQQFGHPVVNNLSSFQGYLPVTNANNSQDSQQCPILVPNPMSSQATSIYSVSNHRSEASLPAPKLISQPRNSTANGVQHSGREPAAKGRRAEEVRSSIRDVPFEEVIDAQLFAFFSGVYKAASRGTFGSPKA